MSDKMPGTEKAWESGALGQEEAFVAVSDIDVSAVDTSLELKAISIRMQQSLIDDLKDIAKIRGLGYQPLMKQVLKRFVESEKKQLLREKVAELEKADQESEQHRDESMQQAYG